MQEAQPEAAVNSTAVLNSLIPGVSNQILQAESRSQESLDQIRFVFHPWVPIPNSTLKGYSFGVQHFILDRMRLIPIKPWRTPVILPRANGFSIGALTEGGALPSGAVGSKVTFNWQYPNESVRMLSEAYGKLSAKNIGMVELSSLASDNDDGKLESILIFHGLMQTPFEEGSPLGRDVLLEDFPKWLRTEGSQLLASMMDNGVVAGDTRHKLGKFAKRKAERLIQDLSDSVAAARKRALDDTTGLLPLTKQDMRAGEKGATDGKRIPDKLDEWLLRQFPSFSMDTDVERATRANASVTNAIRQSGEDSNLTMRQLLEMNTRLIANQETTMEELRGAHEINRQMLMDIRRLNNERDKARNGKQTAPATE